MRREAVELRIDPAHIARVRGSEVMIVWRHEDGRVMATYADLPDYMMRQLAERFEAEEEGEA